MRESNDVGGFVWDPSATQLSSHGPACVLLATLNLLSRSEIRGHRFHRKYNVAKPFKSKVAKPFKSNVAKTCPASKLLRVACWCHLQRKKIIWVVAKVRFLLAANWICQLDLPTGFASFLGICHFRELRVRSRVAIRQLREFRLANFVSFCVLTEKKAIWANRQLRQKLNSRHTCSKLLSKTSRSSKVAVYLYNLVCQCLGGWIELLSVCKMQFAVCKIQFCQFARYSLQFAVCRLSFSSLGQ